MTFAVTVGGMRKVFLFLLIPVLSMFSAGVAWGFSSVSPADSNPVAEGVFMDPLERTSWGASDGFISFGLPDGKTLWLLGDTETDDGHFVRNTAAIWNGVKYSFMRGVDDSGFIDHPGDPMKNWYWPGTPLSRGSDIFIPVSSMGLTSAPGPWNFTQLRAELLKYSYNGKSLKLKSSRVLPYPKIVWGSASIKIGKYMYFYGFKGVPHSVYVLRIDDKDNIEVLSKKGWVSRSSVSNLKQVGDNFSSGFSVMPCGQVLCAIVKTGDLGRNVDLYKASDVSGKFVFARKLFSVDGTVLAYHSKAHPSLKAPKGMMWVTVNNNDTGMYRPSWFLVNRSAF